MSDRRDQAGGPLRVLMVDDSADDAELVFEELRRGGRAIEAERVCDAPSMRAWLERATWDLVLSDWSMPSFSGAAALELLRGAGVDVPFIIVSGTVTEELAIKAMRSGARDWVVKTKLGRLLPAVERELREADERRRNAEALRRSDERLRQSQKMDAIGGLAAGVAHDFNNVLSVIIGHAVLLSEERALSRDGRDSVDEIRKAAERAAELTRQLLAFSRQQVLQPRRTDLNRVVAGMEKMVRRLIGEDVELTVVPGDDLGAVLVDPGQMEQVILNLAVNARDAMPRGGALVIETANVDVAAGRAGEPPVAPGSYVMVQVRDTGVGMDEATKAHIFEPFFTTKEPGRGTGLGLATVFGIVAQSAGSVWADSAPGAGTTFKILLPRVQGVGESGDGPWSAGGPRRDPLDGHETILLVEDDEPVRAVVRTVLAKRGYRVVEAPNAEEALRLYGASPDGVDLVLTDVIMPRLSGPELVARLAALRPDVKVVYMSGYTDKALGPRGVLEPGTAFLQKPVLPEALLRKVREVLDAGGRARAAVDR